MTDPSNETKRSRTKIIDFTVVGSRRAFDGNAVADVILSACGELALSLSDQATTILRKAAEAARHHHAPLPGEGVHISRHLLTDYRKDAPLYCALSDGGQTQITAAQIALLRTARWLVALMAAEPDGANGVAKKVSFFIHQILFKDKPAAPALAKFAPESPTSAAIEKSLEGIEIALANKQIDKTRGKEFREILEALCDYIDASEPDIEPQTSIAPPVHSVERDSTELTAFQAPISPTPETPTDQNVTITLTVQAPLAAERVFNDLVDPDIEHAELAPVLDEVSQQLLSEAANESAALSLNEHGHWLRLNRRYAGRTTEGFSVIEARLSLEFLLAYQASSIEIEVARMIWVLVGMTGRRYDDIARALLYPKGKKEALDGELFNVELIHNHLAFHIRHEIGSALADAPLEWLDHAPEQYFTLRLCIPDKIRLSEVFSYIALAQKDTSIEAKILRAKIDINSAVRKCVDRFNETRFRGTLVQACFYEDYDLPLTQLLFSERFETSRASLHYLAYSETFLQKRLAQVQSAVYDSLLPDQPQEGRATQIGAPRAGLSLDALNKAAAWFNTSQRRLRKMSGKRWRERHQLLVETTVHALGVGAGHRFNKDLKELRRWDLSLTFGLALFREKPTDSSVYRRLAVLPSPVLDLLHRYLDHLDWLVNDQEHGIPADVKEAAKDALEGKGPLFWLWDLDEIVPPTPREKLKELLPDGVPPYFMRHIQATVLREMGAPPLLLEVHLGHNVDAVFGRNGVVSPIELAESLRSYLDQLFASLNYQIPKFSSSSRSLFLLSQDDLFQLDREEQSADHERWKQQLLSSTRNVSIATLRQAVEKAICQHVPHYKDGKIPSKTHINAETARKIHRTLKNTLGQDALTRYRANRRLRRTLARAQENTPSAYVSLPPLAQINSFRPLPINRAHIAAAELRAQMEEKILQACRSPGTDLATLTQLGLLVWGNCPDLEEARSWMALYSRTPAIKKRDFQVIELKSGESRTLAGVPLLLCSAWYSAGCPKSRVSPADFLSVSATDDTVEAWMNYSRGLHYGICLEKRLAGQLPGKELSRDRLLDWLLDRPTSLPAKKRNRVKSSKHLSSPVDIPTKQVQKQFESLRKLIPKDGEWSVSREKLQDEIRRWMTDEPRPQLIALLAEWSVQLLGPHANLLNGKTLRNNTVRLYIKYVWELLSTAYPNGELEDLGSEDDQYDEADAISDILSSAQTPIDELRKSTNENEAIITSQKSGIQRFFTEVWSQYRLAPIRLSGVRCNNDSLIDAEVITSMELGFLRRALEDWSESPNTSVQLVPGILQLKEVLEIFASHGPRRREITEIRYTDIVSHLSQSEILIREHSKRKLKRPSSVRNFTLVPAITMRDKNHQESSYWDFLNFKNSKSMLLGELDKLISEITGGRIHHFRHTLGTDFTLAGIMEPDPINKIRILARGAADIGHANVLVTLIYYAHAMCHAIALSDSKKQPKLDVVSLSNLFSITQATVRKRISRSEKQGFSYLANFITARETAGAKKMKGRKRWRKAEDSRTIVKNEAAHSIRSTLTWVLQAARGNDPFLAAEGAELSINQLKKIIHNLRETQKNIRWQAVADSRLTEFITLLNSKETQFIEKTPTHKTFPESEIDELISGVPSSVTTVPGVILAQLESSNLENAKDVVIPSRGDTLLKLEKAFLLLNIELLAESNPRNHGQLRIYMASFSQRSRHRRNLTKLIILGLLAHPS